MNGNTTVTPQVGHYVVSTANRFGVQIHQVTKDKRCTCGGNSRRKCTHIRAVVTYLKEGGRRAQERPSMALRDKGGPLSGSPALACPVCGTSVQSLGHGMWRCPRDSSHYWLWRGERNGGAIHKFFTQPHPAKQGVFYEQTTDEREAFLQRVALRMHADG